MARCTHALAALLALCAMSPASAAMKFTFVKSTDTYTDTDLDGFLPSWLEDGQVLQIPIGVDPSLIDPKTWVNFTAPDSDLWLVPSGSDSDSDSDSNVDLHASVVRIVFHYLSFAVGKNHATNLMNAMDAPDALPTFAVASSVAAQSDDTCETAEGEGWKMAQLTTQEFMSADNQKQVAQVLTSSVGEDVPVMTGVKTESGDCLTVQATDSDTVWTSADCDTEAAALCASSVPNPDMQDIFIATVSAEVGTATSGTAISTIGLFSPANMLVVCLCATAMFGLVQARRMKQRQGGSAEEKMPLYSAPAVNNGAISQSPATLV